MEGRLHARGIGLFGLAVIGLMTPAAPAPQADRKGAACTIPLPYASSWP